MLFKFKHHFYSAFLLTLVFSCRTIEKPASKIDQARDYLNQRNYEQAEILLREILREDPSSGYVRVLLASAIAGSTGFDFIKPIASIKAMLEESDQNKASLKLTGMIPNPENVPTDVQGKNLYIEKSLRGMTRESLEFFRAAGYFPYQEKGVKRDRIKEAIILLDEVGPNERDYTSAVGFSFILNSMQFLNLLRDSFGQYTFSDGKTTRVKRDSELLCSVNHAELVESVILMTFYMSNAVKNINELAVTRGNVATSIERLLKSTKSFERIVDASRSDLRFIGDAVDAIAKNSCE